MLEINELRVRYGDAVLGVESATMHVQEGAVVALLGANGAGKSSLLRAIGGLLTFHRGQVDSGEILFRGESVVGLSAPALVRRGIAQSLEGRRVFADLTVEENLKLGGFRHKRRHEHETVFELFPRLQERATQLAGTLSGGEQQMLAIGRALMASPQLLLLDEPSLGLAPKIVEEIAEAIRAIARAGASVLLVDQNVTMARRASDVAVLMDRGITRASGATAEILQDPRLYASYLGEGANGGRIAG